MLANKITATGSLTFRKRHELGSTDWKALSTVASLPGSSGAAVADLLGLDRGAISRTLKVLSAKGLVHVEKATRQGNHQSVTLTSEGRAVHATALITAWEREQAMVNGIGLKHRRELIAGLRAMLANMDAVAALAEHQDPHIMSRKGLEHLACSAATEDAAAGPGEIAESTLSSVDQGDSSAEIQRLREENRKMRRIIADLMMENTDLRDFAKTQ